MRTQLGLLLLCSALLVGSTDGTAADADTAGRIVVVSDVSPAALVRGGRVNGSRLLLLDTRGTTTVMAADSAVSDGPAALSPDGHMLAFLRTSTLGGGGRPELWISRSDGSGQRRLFVPESQESFSDGGGGPPLFATPAWSPDGRLIALEAVSTASCGPSSTKCADWYTILVDLDGRRLDTIGGLQPVWSPDGKTVAVLAGLFSLEDASEWLPAVQRLDGRGPDLHLRKAASACWGDTAWSADGSRLAVAEETCGGRPLRIHLVETRTMRERTAIAGGKAVWSKTGSLLAYTVKRGSRSTLELADANGSHLRTLGTGVTTYAWAPDRPALAFLHGPRLLLARTAGPIRTIGSGLDGGSQLVWSRDGRRVAVLAARHGVASVSLVDTSSGAHRLILLDLPHALLHELGFTAAGELAITRFVEPAPSQLWTMLPDGSDLRRLTADSSQKYGPKWSPDRTTIAFTADTPRTAHRPETVAVYVVAAAGGPARRLAGDATRFASDPAWSADGEQIIYTRSGKATAQTELRIVDVDGRNDRLLLSGSFSDVAWSPNGDQIAYSDNNGRITIAHANGRGGHPLSDDYRTWSCRHTAWSPDGSRLAFVCDVAGLISIASDGSDLRIVDANAAPEVTGLCFSPDGETLLYPDHDGRLRLIPAKGGASTSLDVHSARAAWPDWG